MVNNVWANVRLAKHQAARFKPRRRRRRNRSWRPAPRRRRLTRFQRRNRRRRRRRGPRRWATTSAGSLPRFHGGFRRGPYAAAALGRWAGLAVAPPPPARFRRRRGAELAFRWRARRVRIWHVRRVKLDRSLHLRRRPLRVRLTGWATRRFWKALLSSFILAIECRTQFRIYLEVQTKQPHNGVRPRKGRRK